MKIFLTRTLINTKVLNDDYYKILKEDMDNVISYSVTFKQVVERLKKNRLSSLFS